MNQLAATDPAHASAPATSGAARMAALLHAIGEAADRVETSSPEPALLTFGAVADARGEGAWARYLRSAALELVRQWNDAETAGAQRAALEHAERLLGLRNWKLYDYRSAAAILDEMNDTQGAFRSLGIDISNRFCVPFRAELARRVDAFRARTGRLPTNEETRQLLREMGVTAPENPLTARCYQSEFVSAWSIFYTEWTNFYLGHQAWIDRQWYSVYTITVDYKSAILDWRRRFESLGGKPSAPDPQIPYSADKPGGGVPWGQIITLAAVVAAIVIVPPILRTVGSK